MIKKTSTILMLFFALVMFAGEQPKLPQDANAILVRLPDSEVAMFINARRLFSDALPLLTAGDPAQLAATNQQIERFKQQTGIDARDFDMMAVSLDFSPKITSLYTPKGTLTLDPVVLARSSRNNAEQILAAVKRVSATSIGGKPLSVETRTRQYKGKEILIVRVDEATLIFGLFDLKNKEVAIVALDAETVAVGNLEAVRDAISADDGGRRVDLKIVRLAVRSPNVVMGFAGVIPGYVSSRIKFGTPELSRPFRELRGFYGALETASDDFILTTNLQTTGAVAANDESRTINLVKDFIPGLINQLPAILGKAAGAAVARAENATVNSSGTEVVIRIELKTN